MEKLSSEKVAKVLRDAQTALLTVTEERDKLAAENAAMKQRAECEKLAADMHAKGLESDKSIDELAESLSKEAEAGNLGEIQRAVEMIGPNMSFASKTANHDAPGGGNDVFTNFILGSIG